MTLVLKIKAIVTAIIVFWSSCSVLAEEATCKMKSGHTLKINTDDYSVLIVDGKYRHHFRHDGMNPEGVGGYTTYSNSKYEYTLVSKSEKDVIFIYMENYRNVKDSGRCIYSE